MVPVIILFSRPGLFLSKLHNNPSNIIPESALFCNDSKPAYFVHMKEPSSPIFRRDGVTPGNYRVTNEKSPQGVLYPCRLCSFFILNGTGIRSVDMFIDTVHTQSQLVKLKG